MFGGDSNNLVFPMFVDDNRFQCEATVLPQLQLFGNLPVGCNMGSLNYMGNEHAMHTDRPVKRGREAESTIQQQKHHVSLDKSFHQDESGQPCSFVNPNPVSTGLRLSYEEDEHNSSVTSVSESMNGGLPVMASLENIKVEIDRQKEELDRYIRLQEENIMKGVRELKHRHTISFLSAIEEGVGKKLQEKDIELESVSRKNKELVERIRQASMEAQSWQYRAKYNESMVNVLRSNLKQVMAQGAMHAKEGCGDSEVDDTASYTNQNHLSFVDGSGKLDPTKKTMICRSCKVKEVSVLLLPCRHLCLCTDCEGFIEVCPICRVMKTASVQVYMS